MKTLSLISQTILSKKNQYKLIISLCLLALMMITGTSFAGEDSTGCC